MILKKLTVLKVASAVERSAVMTAGLLVRNPDKQATKVGLAKRAKSCFNTAAARVMVFAAAATNCRCLSVEIT